MKQKERSSGKTGVRQGPHDPLAWTAHDRSAVQRLNSSADFADTASGPAQGAPAATTNDPGYPRNPRNRRSAVDVRMAHVALARRVALQARQGSEAGDLADSLASSRRGVSTAGTAITRIKSDHRGSFLVDWCAPPLVPPRFLVFRDEPKNAGPDHSGPAFSD